MAKGSDISRRDFLKSSAGGASLAALGSVSFIVHPERVDRKSVV